MASSQAKDIREFLHTSCDRSGDGFLFSILELNRASREYYIKSITGKEFERKAYQQKASQTISGIGSDARVALIGEASVDWLLNFFAALLNGATLCPVDLKMTADETSNLLEHLQATHVLVDDGSFEKVKDLKIVTENRCKLIRFSDFTGFPAKWVESLVSKDSASATDPDLIIYTSGTSDKPKGAVVSLASLYFQSLMVEQTFPPHPYKRAIFSILPLNHIYGLCVGLFCNMWTGREVCLSQSLEPANIQRILKERDVVRFAAVPLFLSLLKSGIETKVRQQALLKRLIFNLAIRVNSKLKSKFIANKVFAQVKQGLGESLELFVSGGASLDPRIEAFFDAMNWPIYDGYGLTETGPIISNNSFTEKRRGTVGVALPGVEVKIIDGEICTRGPHLFKSYFKAEDLTKEAFTEDGWFKTGDLGVLDKDGFLSVTGRKKNMIVLASGKKVQPEEVEDKLTAIPYVKFACLVPVQGEGHSEKLVAVLELHKAYSDFLSEPNQLDRLTAELKKSCATLSPHKRPQHFLYRTYPFEVTSSQKVKRHIVKTEVEKQLQ